MSIETVLIILLVVFLFLILCSLGRDTRPSTTLREEDSSVSNVNTVFAHL